MDVEITPTWQGPTQLPEDVVVVGSAAAWERVRASWSVPLRARVDIHPQWEQHVVLVVAGPETGDLGLVLRVARCVRTDDGVAMEVVAESKASTIPAPSAMNHPTLVMTAPVAAFAGDPPITLQWNGKAWPVRARYER